VNKLTEKELTQLRQSIKAFDFESLFNQLGWDSASFKKSISTAENQYHLIAIAQKRGFTVFVCSSEQLPNQSERKKIAREMGILYHENLLIYANHEQQIWQSSIKELNKPIQYKETQYYCHQEPQLLLSRLQGLFFSLDEEENIYLLDVSQRVNTQFNSNTEKTTKKFYDHFKKQHSAFMAFITGLDNQDDKRWYTSFSRSHALRGNEGT
jgi:hypothetical protein